MRQAAARPSLLTGSIPRHIVRLAWPMIIAFMFVTSYNFLDRYFVSWLGDVATAAIGMAFTVQMVIISVGVGVGNGINSFIARSLGANDDRAARQAAIHAIFLAVAIGIVVAVVGLSLQYPLFRLLGAEGELLDMIIRYLTIILIFTPVNLMTIFSSSVFQGWGDTVSPTKFMLLGTVLNLFLDPLLIVGYVLGVGVIGDIGIGIEGAAYATVIGRGASLGYIIYKVWVQKQPTALNFRGFRPQKEIISGIFKVGLPSSISQILTSVAMGFIFYILDPFGAAAKAAYTIVFTYEMVVFLPAIGLSQAVSILTGHNFGAGNLKRVGKIFYTGTLMAFALMSMTALVLMYNPALFASVFADSEQVLDISSRALRITAYGFAFSSVYLCSVASFQGLGLGRQYLMANIFRLYVLLVPLTLTGAWMYGADGVWIGLMMVNVLSAGGLFLWHQYIYRYYILNGKIQPF